MEKEKQILQFSLYVYIYAITGGNLIFDHDFQLLRDPPFASSSSKGARYKFSAALVKKIRYPY